jgi:hypothetical protein
VRYAHPDSPEGYSIVNRPTHPIASGSYSGRVDQGREITRPCRSHPRTSRTPSAGAAVRAHGPPLQ